MPIKVGPSLPPADLQSAMDDCHAKIESLKEQLVSEQAKLDSLIYQAHRKAAQE